MIATKRCKSITLWQAGLSTSCHNNEQFLISITFRLNIYNDDLGSVTLITDSSGNVIENSFHSPFGEIIMNPLIFTQTGILIQSVYDPQSLNRYAFERNNPYKYTDPTGHLLNFIPQSCYASTLCNQALYYAQTAIRNFLTNPQAIARAVYRAPEKIEKISNSIQDFVKYEDIDKENLPIGSTTYVPIEAKKSKEEICETTSLKCEKESKSIKFDVKIDINLNINIQASQEAKEQLKSSSSGGGGSGGGNFMFVTINGQTTIIYLTPGIPQSKQIPKTTTTEKDKKDNKPKNKK